LQALEPRLPLNTKIKKKKYMTAKTPRDDVDDINYRDVFAIGAMIGLMFQENYSAKTCAELAYIHADAMLKERKKDGFKNSY
jgi:hypothetical protein